MKGLELGEIHSTALIGKNVSLNSNVTIGANSIIYDNVTIGQGSVIGSNVILGEPTADYYGAHDYTNAELVIGSGAVIRSHSILYSGSAIGDNFECGHRVTIREGAVIGRNCRIGTLSDIQGHCMIGNYVRIHSNVFIGQKSVVNDFVWLFPHVVLTNDPYPPSNQILGVRIEPYAAIAAKAVVLPGVVIGKDALVGASATVTKDVPSEAVVVGNPARYVASIRDIKSKEGDAVYPWRYYFDRGMPWEGIGFEQWWLKNDKFIEVESKKDNS